MRTRQTMTISLPPAMIREVEKARRAEHRTRSELIREALRMYLGATGYAVTRTYRPSASDLRSIEHGRAAIRRGEFSTLDEFRAAVGDPSSETRTKKRPARTKA